MQKSVICALILITLSAVSVYAGTGHSHGPGGHSHEPAAPINEQEAVQRATEIVSKIIETGKIDSTWSEIKSSKAEKKKNKHGYEWVVTFNNPKEKDQSRRTLYVFLSLGGKYLGANFSGS